MDYDAFAAIALQMPDTEEARSYGTPSVKRKGRFMFRLKEDGETVAIKLDWETHDRLLVERPLVFYKTPHYEGYPGFLVRLPQLTKTLADELVAASWANAVKASKKKKV